MGCATKNICSQGAQLPIFTPERSFSQLSCTEISSKHNFKTGHFIWCFTCHNYNINKCNDQQYLCQPDEDVCLFERTRSLYDGRDDTEITKRCGKSSECRRSGIIRSSNKTITMNTTCCDKNLCYAALPTLPPISSQDNGLICPSCFIPNSDRCLGRNSLKCTGNENHCIHYMRTDTQDVYSVTENLHGCATNDICEVGSSIVHSNSDKNKHIKTIIVCNGSSLNWKAACSSMDVIIPIIIILQMYVVL
ncbi:phospholipase A2 inhibitor and Ly6/PLAUR domain-containing protein-like isoform X1 [Pseudophryne corroboree]|uniref:phospholipase A2 inhibitor and Ly6/PLAUR domain-containing protein-like isoform X1 n=1 Tax=Pseudophryne corroboree TaxID=495146 RepID=UPI00308133DD